MTGSAVDLSLAQERANAVLQAWYPGSQGGRAVAQVLFGEASPSGKLPVTFYRGVEDLPDFTDYAMAGRTYRYYQGEPLYPFGYGLTYGDCRWPPPRPSPWRRACGCGWPWQTGAPPPGRCSRST